MDSAKVMHLTLEEIKPKHNPIRIFVEQAFEGDSIYVKATNGDTEVHLATVTAKGVLVITAGEKPLKKAMGFQVHDSGEVVTG